MVRSECNSTEVVIRPGARQKKSVFWRHVVWGEFVHLYIIKRRPTFDVYYQPASVRGLIIAVTVGPDWLEIRNQTIVCAESEITCVILIEENIMEQQFVTVDVKLATGNPLVDLFRVAENWGLVDK